MLAKIIVSTALLSVSVSAFRGTPVEIKPVVASKSPESQSVSLVNTEKSDTSLTSKSAAALPALSTALSNVSKVDNNGSSITVSALESEKADTGAEMGADMEVAVDRPMGKNAAECWNKYGNAHPTLRDVYCVHGQYKPKPCASCILTWANKRGNEKLQRKYCNRKRCELYGQVKNIRLFFDNHCSKDKILGRKNKLLCRNVPRCFFIRGPEKKCYLNKDARELRKEWINHGRSDPTRKFAPDCANVGVNDHYNCKRNRLPSRFKSLLQKGNKAHLNQSFGKEVPPTVGLASDGAGSSQFVEMDTDTEVEKAEADAEADAGAEDDMVVPESAETKTDDGEPDEVVDEENTWAEEEENEDSSSSMSSMA